MFKSNLIQKFMQLTSHKSSSINTGDKENMGFSEEVTGMLDPLLAVITSSSEWNDLLG